MLLVSIVIQQIFCAIIFFFFVKTELVLSNVKRYVNIYVK